MFYPKHSVDCISASIKYWTFSKNIKKALETGYHSHPHWQIDFIALGRPQIRIGKLDNQHSKSAFEEKVIDRITQKGDIVVIPPYWRHNYIFPDDFRSNLSIKLEVRNLDASVTPEIINSSECDVIRNYVIETLGGKASLSMSERCFAEYLIGAVIDMKYIRNLKKLSEAPVVTAVRNIINNANGKPLKVEYVAKRLGYSRNHLSTIFKRSQGHSLKTFLDSERLKIAKNFLTYSDLNISQIADEMGFKDVFTFSRFFRLREGVCPSVFLQNNR